MDIFFYGLFMDSNVLRKNGVKPSNLRKGYLDDYALKIGNRASLVPAKNERSYGIVMTIEKDALRKLYAQPSVADYIPEGVSIVTETNNTIPALCYNLPMESLTGTNTSYATSLHALAKQLGFPKDYLEKIKKMAKTTSSRK